MENPFGTGPHSRKPTVKEAPVVDPHFQVKSQLTRGFQEMEEMRKLNKDRKDDPKEHYRLIRRLDSLKLAYKKKQQTLEKLKTQAIDVCIQEKERLEGEEILQGMMELSAAGSVVTSPRTTLLECPVTDQTKRPSFISAGPARTQSTLSRFSETSTLSMANETAVEKMARLLRQTSELDIRLSQQEIDNDTLKHMLSKFKKSNLKFRNEIEDFKRVIEVQDDRYGECMSLDQVATNSKTLALNEVAQLKKDLIKIRENRSEFLQFKMTTIKQQEDQNEQLEIAIASQQQRGEEGKKQLEFLEQELERQRYEQVAAELLQKKVNNDTILKFWYCFSEIQRRFLGGYDMDKSFANRFHEGEGPTFEEFVYFETHALDCEVDIEEEPIMDVRLAIHRWEDFALQEESLRTRYEDLTIQQKNKRLEVETLSEELEGLKRENDPILEYFDQHPEFDEKSHDGINQLKILLHESNSQTFHPLMNAEIDRFLFFAWHLLDNLLGRLCQAIRIVADSTGMGPRLLDETYIQALEILRENKKGLALKRAVVSPPTTRPSSSRNNESKGPGQSRSARRANFKSPSREDDRFIIPKKIEVDDDNTSGLSEIVDDISSYCPLNEEELLHIFFTVYPNDEESINEWLNFLRGDTKIAHFLSTENLVYYLKSFTSGEEATLIKNLRRLHDQAKEVEYNKFTDLNQLLGELYLRIHTEIENAEFMIDQAKSSDSLRPTITQIFNNQVSKRQEQDIARKIKSLDFTNPEQFESKYRVVERHKAQHGRRSRQAFEIENESLSPTSLGSHKRTRFGTIKSQSRVVKPAVSIERDEDRRESEFLDEKRKEIEELNRIFAKTAHGSTKSERKVRKEQRFVTLYTPREEQSTRIKENFTIKDTIKMIKQKSTGVNFKKRSENFVSPLSKLQIPGTFNFRDPGSPNYSRLMQTQTLDPNLDSDFDVKNVDNGSHHVRAASAVHVERRSRKNLTQPKLQISTSSPMSFKHGIDGSSSTKSKRVSAPTTPSGSRGRDLRLSSTGNFPEISSSTKPTSVRSTKMRKRGKSTSMTSLNTVEKLKPYMKKVPSSSMAMTESSGFNRSTFVAEDKKKLSNTQVLLQNAKLYLTEEKNNLMFSGPNRKTPKMRSSQSHSHVAQSPKVHDEDEAEGGHFFLTNARNTGYGPKNENQPKKVKKRKSPEKSKKSGL